MANVITGMQHATRILKKDVDTYIFHIDNLFQSYHILFYSFIFFDHGKSRNCPNIDLFSTILDFISENPF